MFEYTHKIESECKSTWVNIRWNAAAAIARAIISPDSPIEFGTKVKEQVCTLALRTIFGASNVTAEDNDNIHLPEYDHLIEFMQSHFIWDIRFTPNNTIIVRIWDFN